MWECVSVRTGAGEARPPGAGVKGSFKLPSRGASNQIQVLCESSVRS